MEGSYGVVLWTANTTQDLVPNIFLMLLHTQKSFSIAIWILSSQPFKSLTEKGPIEISISVTLSHSFDGKKASHLGHQKVI